MDYERDFWHRERSLLNNQGFYQSLSFERKICYVLFCLFILTWAFYLGLSLAGALTPPWHGYFIDSRALAQDDQQPAADDHYKTILVVGCDKREGDLGRTDTIMVGFLNTETGNLKVLSIPRDTYVEIPSSGEKTKINHAYAYGGISLTENTISKNFNINIDNYLEIDFKGFIELIDAMGGITIDVDVLMSVPEENIYLEPGVKLLDGEQALGYVRFRGDALADIGRIKRQQKFLSVLADDLFSPGSIRLVPKLINVAKNNVDTDLTATGMIRLANIVRQSDISSIEFMMIPGEAVMKNGISYWQADQEETKKMIAYLKGDEVK